MNEPIASEKQMQEAMADFLTRARIPFFRQRMDMAATGTVGWPDFTICVGGKCLLIETKFGKGQLSKGQVECIAKLGAAGTHVHVVRDLAVAITLVTEWRSMIGAVILPAVLTQPAAEEKIFAGYRWHPNPETGRYERGEKIAA
jgi:hypothetical protein